MSDFDALFALYRDPEMRQYYPEGVLSEKDTREELEWFLNGHPKHPELGLWATIYKPNNAFIGRCGLLPWTLEGRDQAQQWRFHSGEVPIPPRFLTRLEEFQLLT